MRSGWKIANLSLQPSAGSGGGSGNDFTCVGQGIVVGLFVDFFLEILILAVHIPEHNTSTLRSGVGVEICCSKFFRSGVLAVDENPRVIYVVILCGSGMNFSGSNPSALARPCLSLSKAKRYLLLSSALSPRLPCNVSIEVFCDSSSSICPSRLYLSPL